MSKAGSKAYTLVITETDESGLKRVRYIPLPADPRPVLKAGLAWKTASDDGPDGIRERWDAEQGLWRALDRWEKASRA